MVISLRPVRIDDLELLLRWDQQDHVIASDPNGDWEWETELTRDPCWREQLIAEIDRRPIGFVQIIDPVTEDGHYWQEYLTVYETCGNLPDRLRAIDIWIGEEDSLGKGYGTEIMSQSISRCFAAPTVEAVLIDPLTENINAQRFYQRFSFEYVARFTFDGDDSQVMRLSRQQWDAQSSKQ